MTTLLALAVLQSQNISAYVQPAFHDATFTAKIVSKNQNELKKINDDFGAGYRVETSTVRIEEPFKVRVDANIEDTQVTYIVNGTKRHFKIPRLRINKAEDLSTKPGNRQTVFDFGIITPSLFESFMDAKFVRMDRATGDVVFDVTYKSVFNDKTRFRIWIDPAKRYITKREWYHRKGRMVATFYYDQPETTNGVTAPTRLTVKNGDDVVAGVTRYDGIKINAGIPDDVFGV